MIMNLPMLMMDDVRFNARVLRITKWTYMTAGFRKPTLDCDFKGNDHNY